MHNSSRLTQYRGSFCAVMTKSFKISKRRSFQSFESRIQKIKKPKELAMGQSIRSFSNTFTLG